MEVLKRPVRELGGGMAEEISSVTDGWRGIVEQ